LLTGSSKGLGDSAFWLWPLGAGIDIEIRQLSPSAFLISGSLLAGFLGSAWFGLTLSNTVLRCL
jgi:hypothetical protein